MSAESCCTKGGCKQMPGQAPHSSCRITPASTDRLTPPIATPVPAPEMVPARIEIAMMQPVSPLPVLTVVAPESSPPPLFLIHASFLI
jgi:hypothetical protein